MAGSTIFTVAHTATGFPSGGALSFVGIIADEPIGYVEFDEANDGDDIGFRDIRLLDRVLADSDGDGFGDACDIDDDGDLLIEIYTVKELDEIRKDLLGKSLLGYNTGCSSCNGYELMNDIDFDTNGSGYIDANDDVWYSYYGGWWPIGSAFESGDIGVPFKAVFDGNGHKISNMSMSAVAVKFGLFYAIEDAEIRNISFEESQPACNTVPKGGLVAGESLNSQIKYIQAVTSGDPACSSVETGGIVGYAENTTLSYVSAIVYFNYWFYKSGGLVGVAVNTQIDNSYTRGFFIGGSIGGLVGGMHGGSVSNSYSAVDLFYCDESSNYCSNYSKDGFTDIVTGSPVFTDSYSKDSADDVPVLTETQLKCPTSSSSAFCGALGFNPYANWSDVYWDFGLSSDYPVHRDTGGDGLLNASPQELDDDGDNWLDTDEENCNKDPLDNLSIPIDTDSDGRCNYLDWDDDNDGVPDVVDAAPLDNANTNEITLPLDSSYKGINFER